MNRSLISIVASFVLLIGLGAISKHINPYLNLFLKILILVLFIWGFVPVLKKSINRGIAAIAFFLTFGLVVDWACFQREYSEENMVATTYDMQPLSVQSKSSQKKFHGGHVLGFGGGDPFCELRIDYCNDRIKWTGKFIPILVNAFEGQVYLAVFDRETDFLHKVAFRYYKQEGSGLVEIPPAKFPKQIAVQNMWLSARDATALTKMDPNDTDFTYSLTAQMWRELATGVGYKGNEAVTESIISEYKKHYLKRN